MVGGKPIRTRFIVTRVPRRLRPTSFSPLLLCSAAKFFSVIQSGVPQKPLPVKRLGGSRFARKLVALLKEMIVTVPPRGQESVRKWRTARRLTGRFTLALRKRRPSRDDDAAAIGWFTW